MLPPYSLIGVAFGLFIIAADIILLRKHKLSGRMFLLWLVYGIAVCYVAVDPSIFSRVTQLLGLQFTLTGVVIAGFAILSVMFLYLNYRIVELQSQLMKLAINVSVEDFTEKSRKADETRGSSDAPDHKSPGQVKPT